MDEAVGAPSCGHPGQLIRPSGIIERNRRPERLDKHRYAVLFSARLQATRYLSNLQFYSGGTSVDLSGQVLFRLRDVCGPNGVQNLGRRSPQHRNAADIRKRILAMYDLNSGSSFQLFRLVEELFLLCLPAPPHTIRPAAAPLLRTIAPTIDVALFLLGNNSPGFQQTYCVNSVAVSHQIY